MAEIRFEDVTCVYPGAGQAAVSHLDLTAHDGELLALCGGPGSGKSTVLRMAAGLVPLSGGSVRIGQHDLADPAAESMVLVFQNYALQPNLTVAQNIALPLVQQGADKRTIAARTEEAASHVGLSSVLRRKGVTLSMGGRIRVALARALVRNPGALLLDEPLSNLQPEIRDEVVELLLTAQRERAITTIYATGDADEALSIGDRVALLDGGVLREVVVPGELEIEAPGQRAVSG